MDGTPAMARTYRKRRTKRRRGRRTRSRLPGARNVRRRLTFKRKGRKSRRYKRSSSLKWTGGAYKTKLATKVKRRMYSLHKKMLSSSSDSNCKSVYITSFALTATQNSSNTTYFSTYARAGGIPTVDPGTSEYEFLRKLYFDHQPTAVTGIDRTRPTYHYGAKHEYTIRSCSDAPVHLRMWNMIARSDQGSDPDALWNTGMNDALKQSADPYGVGAVSNQDLYVTPYLSGDFCKHFKVIGSKTVTIGPGEVINFSVYHPCMRMIDGQWFKPATKYVRNTTYAVMFNLHGSLANDTSNDIYRLRAKVNIEKKTTYKWKLCEATARDQYYYFNNGPLNTAITDVRQINSETDALDIADDMA